MSDGMVRKWVRAFKDGRTNVHDEERSGRPSVDNEDLVQNVDEKILVYFPLLIRICSCELSSFGQVATFPTNQGFAREYVSGNRQQAPQIIYGVPASNGNHAISKPQTQYGVPNRDVEPLGGSNLVQFPTNQRSSNINCLLCSNNPVLQQQQSLSNIRPNGNINFQTQVSNLNLPHRQPQRQQVLPHILTGANLHIFQLAQQSLPTTLPANFNPQLIPAPQKVYGSPPNSNRDVEPVNGGNVLRFPPAKITLPQNFQNHQFINSHKQPQIIFSQDASDIRPQNLYNSPKVTGVETLDIKNPPNSFSQFTQIAPQYLQDLSEYRTITQDALDFYERVRNFPVTRNPASQTQKLQRPPSKLQITQSPALNQNSLEFSQNLAYLNGQQLPRLKSAQFLHSPQTALDELGQNRLPYPAGQSLPLLKSPNFQQNSNTLIYPTDPNLGSLNLLTHQVQNSFLNINQADRIPKSRNNFDDRTNNQNNFQRDVDYLPPTSTERSPIPELTTISPTRGNDQETTNSNGNGGNIAVATAVAGRPFYVLQQDGTLQRVTYSKNQELGGKPEEYTVDYHFKNVPLVFNPLYNLNAPLVAIGK